MTDITSSPPPRRNRTRGLEFHAYFALIFLVALPFGCVAWAFDIAARRTLNLPGPLARAWSEADRVTPLIFSA